MTSGYYFPAWMDGGPKGNRELSEALESLGLEYKQAQLGGVSAEEVVDVIVAWISLKEVFVGAASGVLVLAVEKVAAAVHNVVRKKEPAPGTRNVVSIAIYDANNRFHTSLVIEADQAVPRETIQQLLDAAAASHSNAGQSEG